jgi:hypothetical protein
MTGFGNFRELGDSFEGGKFLTSTFRKAPALANNAGWFDLSVVAGNPVPNYYAATPLKAEVLESRKGLWHGEDKAPSKKFLTNLELIGTTAGCAAEYRLLDYLLFYPFIDGDVTSSQAMDNTTSLPRYTTGAGVQAMLVGVTNSLGGGTFFFNYINQDGEAAVSPVINVATAAQVTGTLATGVAAIAGSSYGPFLPLANGDTGIRSITSIEFSVTTGALYALVLVKPLLTHSVREANMPNEVNLLRQTPFLPQIVDGAYLHLIVNPTASLSGAFVVGNATFVWS